MSRLVDSILDNIDICNSIEAKGLASSVIIIPQDRLRESINHVDKDSVLSSLKDSVQVNILKNEETQKLFEAVSVEVQDIIALNSFFSEAGALGKYTVDDKDRIVRVLENNEIPFDSTHFFLEYPELEQYEKMPSFVKGLEIIKNKTDLPDTWLVEHKELVSSDIISSGRFLGNISNYQQMIVDVSEYKQLEDSLSIIYQVGAAPLTTKDYQCIKQDADSIAKNLRKVLDCFTEGVRFLFIDKWLSNHQLAYDLDTIWKNRDKIDDGSFVASKVNYIAFCYKEAANYDVYTYQEDLVIFALANKKKAFLRLIQQNKDLFATIKQHSVLYAPEFYSGLVNINTLNAKDLSMLVSMRCVDNWLYKLEGHAVTFREFKMLYSAPSEVVELYYNLNINSVDKRLIAVQEILSNSIHVTENVIDMLPEFLEQKKLSDWRNDFSYIKELDLSTTLDILMVYSDVQKFLPYIRNKTEAHRICQNISIYKDMLNIEEVRDSVLKTDKDWLELKAKLQISDDFVEEHKERALQFIMDNGADIMYRYLCRNIRQSSIVQKLVTAEISDQFDKLKYHDGDIEQEIAKDVSTESLCIWKNDAHAEMGDISVFEDTKLLDVMQIGEIPTRTCMSYKDGIYSNCLLSNFDSNKKIIFAKVGEEIVFRAIIRLTKGCTKSTNVDTFTFTDVTKAESVKIQSNLVIFLERPYIKDKFVSCKKSIFKLIFSMLRTKAKEMGAILICSDSYKDWQDSLTRMQYYVYISQSKAGEQYLDSLGGEATSSNDRRFCVTFIYVHKDDVALLS